MVKVASAWYLDRTPRERRLLLAGAIVLAIGGAYRLAWAPLQQERLTQLARFRWLIQASAGVQQLSVAEKVVQGAPPASISATLTDSARQKGVTLTKIEVRPDSSATVFLTAVPFDKLVLWLDGLEQAQVVYLTELTIGKADGPGLVTAVVAFSGAGV